MSNNKREHKLRMFALREQILAIIEEQGQLHSHQLARLIGVKPISIASCCVSLEKRGWLAHGELITCNDGGGKALQGWVRGENRSPLPHPDDGLRRRTVKPLEKPKHRDRIRKTPRNKLQKARGVTDEDLQWMAHYRQRYHLRQAQKRPECVIDQTLTNAV